MSEGKRPVFRAIMGSEWNLNPKHSKINERELQHDL
jgi:hypothetical protein